MSDSIRKWFDEEIKWAKDKAEELELGCADYYEGYKKAMETAKGKLLREGII